MSKLERLAPKLITDLMADLKIGLLDACAILGNAGHESKGLEILQEIAPTVKGSRGGYGWFQWTGPRRRAFEAWCRQHGLSPDSDEANYDFLIYELRTTEKAAILALTKAPDLNAKTVAFEKAFERSSVKAYAKRQAWAQRCLDAWNRSLLNPSSANPLPDVEAPPTTTKPSKPKPWGKLVLLGALVVIALAAIIAKTGG
jgi:hypothetical protein